MKLESCQNWLLNKGVSASKLDYSNIKTGNVLHGKQTCKNMVAVESSSPFVQKKDLILNCRVKFQKANSQIPQGPKMIPKF